MDITKVMKRFLRLTLPPIIYKLFYRSKYGWFLGVKDWDDAVYETIGYNDESILKKVFESVKLVKEGKACFERDSVAFTEPDYHYPTLSGILWIATLEKNYLNIIDFGGSLGSFYYQHKKMLPIYVKWNIVEQSNFVNLGRDELQDDVLKFYYDIDNCLKENNPNLFILSSVLQYIKNPFELLNKILSYRFKYILIDRTGFTKNKKDFVAIQKVDPSIYKASYPCWFFNSEKFLSYFSQYEMIFKFDSLDVYNLKNTYSKGFLFKLNSHE